MSKDSYMNKCPACDRPFFCEHKMDFRCPLCRIKELEAALYDAHDNLDFNPDWCSTTETKALVMDLCHKMWNGDE